MKRVLSLLVVMCGLQFSVGLSGPSNRPHHKHFEPDVRITRAMGPRGYDKMRVSVIHDQTYPNDTIFDYSSQFKHKWKDKYLSSGIVSVTPGQTTKVSVLGKDINIYLPKENDGVRGIIFADPCYRSGFLGCLYGEKYDLFHRHIAFLDAAFKNEGDVSYWQILGDNFYDDVGDTTSEWFAALSPQTRAAPFATVPGNHDFWIDATPGSYLPSDQLANGFMQFFGQDTIAAMKNERNNADDHSPYDFSVPPTDAYALPKASNFFFYNKIGNTAFVGFSGAHKFKEMKPYFDEACEWIVSAKADVVLLVGHWHEANNGAEFDTTTPNAYNNLIANPKCSPIASKIRYFQGHKHCNVITQHNVGFMVGAQGMYDIANCLQSGIEIGVVETLLTAATVVARTMRAVWSSFWHAAVFQDIVPQKKIDNVVRDFWKSTHEAGGAGVGMPVVDTTKGRFRVYYFPIAHDEKDEDTVDNFDDLLTCIEAHGISGCYSYAKLWADVCLNPLSEQLTGRCTA